MLKLRVVQARYGDCLILEHGSGKRRKHVLIDGGPSKVYGPYLRPVLEQIRDQGGRLDLVVLTHVDSDHVLGLLELMRDIKACRAAGKPEPVAVRAMWHNAFDQVMPEIAERAAAEEEEVMLDLPPDEAGATPFSIGEGEQLQAACASLGIPRNGGFRDPFGLVRQETAARPVRGLGARLWVLGPTQPNLDALKQKWLAWLASRGDAVSFGVTPAVVKPDDSVQNLSSVMLLAEAGAGRSLRRILLTGDGLMSDVVCGLEQAGLLQPGETFHVDILKLPHHGSARNISGPRSDPAVFFDRIRANTYLISADGRHNNPDWETLCWLTDAARRQQRLIKIFATNPTENLARLAAERPEADFSYQLSIMPRGERSALL